MAEESRPWAGTTVGDAGPYSDDDWDDIWGILYGSEASPYNNRGVIRNWKNELAVTSPGVNAVDVATGAALVHGKFYRNTAVVNVVGIPSAPGGAGHTWREDLICLQSSWVAQTIRVYRHANPADEVIYPAPTQTDGTCWEIPLAAVRINDAGTIILITDLRDYVSDLMQPKQIQVRPRITASGGGTEGMTWNHHGIQLVTPPHECYFEFMVPLDFKEKVTAYVRFIPCTTGTIDWTAAMYAGGCGEDRGAVSDSATADGLAVTDAKVTCLDISSVLDGLKAGDEVGVVFRLDAKVTTTDIFILLLAFHYK